MIRSKVIVQRIVSQDGEAKAEVKEDVSETSSSGDDSSLEIDIKNGKAHIRSKGFKVAKKEIKNKTGNSISVEATSSGKSATSKVSVTTSTSDTLASEVLDKTLDKLDDLLKDLDNW
jgi:hypothetical protein